ncbi:hypothetical protein DH2020_029167 [Rehmannia glutinosa]|uniref:Ubiquitin-like domain-containing protein n=1 Tax=Rehmannia glutinosa TaxID=99300 RepID=A0ABR0VSE0_REHGL
MESQIHQVFVKLLDGKHRILNFNEPSISVSALKQRIQKLTSIPSHLQLLYNNSHILHDHRTLALALSHENSPFPETTGPNSDSQLAQDQDLIRFRFTASAENLFPIVVHLLLRLRGGKGGFGSLLRGAATKAGQKKTNNFDACRDMSGRRLRHVNAEKKLEEWRAEAEERKLEKMAEEFIKKKTKELVKSGKSNGSDSAEKYVAKYREDSAKCMEEVERSVRESVKGLMSSKRKSHAKGIESASKRVKICHSYSCKEAEASSGSITLENHDAGTLDRGSSGSGSEEEDAVSEESLKSDKSLDGCCEDGNSNNKNNPVLESFVENRDHNKVVSEVRNKSHSREVDEVASAVEVGNSFTPETVQEESVPYLVCHHIH